MPTSPTEQEAIVQEQGITAEEQQANTGTERPEPGSGRPEDPIQLIQANFEELFIQGTIEEE